MYVTLHLLIFLFTLQLKCIRGMRFFLIKYTYTVFICHTSSTKILDMHFLLFYNIFIYHIQREAFCGALLFCNCFSFVLLFHCMCLENPSKTKKMQWLSTMLDPGFLMIESSRGNTALMTRNSDYAYLRY